MFLEVSIGTTLRLINLSAVESIVPEGKGCRIWFKGEGGGSINVADSYDFIKAALQRTEHLA